MKTNHIFIALSLFILMTACGRQTNRYWLDQAESYLPMKPDSAWIALKEIRFPEQLEGKEKADYWHFHAKARRNSNRTFINDSLLSYSISYYQSVNDSSYLRECYRLEAQRQVWMKNIDEADSLYRRAIAVCPQYEFNHVLALYDQLVILHCRHMNQKNYPLARQYAQRILNLTEDLEWKANAYYSLAVIYNHEGLHLDSSLIYTDTCLQYVYQLPVEERSFYLSNCANMPKMDPRKAFRLLDESSKIDSTAHCSNLTTKAYIYLAMGKADSAFLICQQAKELYQKNFVQENKGYPTLHNSLITLQACTSYALHPQDIRVTDFIYNDSIQAVSVHQQRVNIEQAETQQILLEKQLYLSIQQQHLKLLLMGILCVVILLSGIIYLYIRHRRLRWLASEEKIESLEQLLKAAKANTEEIPAADGAFFRRILLKQLGLIRLLASSPTRANQELLREFNRLGENGNQPAEQLLVWQELYPIIDASYNNFYTELAKRYHDLLNEKEIQLCCLLRAGFSTKEINAVTGQSISTIYHRKIDIRKKLRLEETGALTEFFLTLQGGDN